MEHIEKVLITPELATKLLEKNTGNRAVSQRNLDFLTNQMANGQWRFAADPIRISKNGTILDGQHRLKAIIKSGLSFEFLVISNLEESIFSVIDTGKARSASDVLTIANFKNSGPKAAITRMILNYQAGQYSVLRSRDSGAVIGGGYNTKSNLNATNAKILEFVENVDLDDVVEIASRCYNSFKMLSKSEYGFFYYIFSLLSVDAANDFLIKLSTGLNLSENDPILLLRNKLIAESLSTIKVGAKIKMILILKCWNYYRKGETIKILQYTTQQSIPIPI